jgi:hypothetical protein
MLGVQMMELLGIEATGICDMQGTARGRQQGTVFKVVYANRMLLRRDCEKGEGLPRRVAAANR